MMTSSTSTFPVASWAKKIGGGKTVQFSNGELRISNRGDHGCLKFNFSPKLSQIGGFLAPNFVFWKTIFQQKEKFLKG